MSNDLEKEKLLAAKDAVKFISNNQVIGLGTGSTATYAIKEIGKLVIQGLKIEGIPTSFSTKQLAESLGIPIRDIIKTEFIDITIDGADEFTTDLTLIKGGGGALFKEKIVASMTKKEIIIADSSKKVDTLGKFKLPIEVIPFASNYVSNKLKQTGGAGIIRMRSGKPFITEQGNFIIDTDFGMITDPIHLSKKLNEIEGIVAHGLFIKMADTIIMGYHDSTIIYKRPDNP